MLNIGLDTARNGLAELADTGWMMSLPRQDPRSGHPAGQGRPAASGGAIAVTFGKLAVPGRGRRTAFGAMGVSRTGR